MSGPELLRNRLVKNFQFRVKEYAIKACIESIIIKVAGEKNKCKFLMLLWFSGPNSKIETYEYNTLFGHQKLFNVCQLRISRGEQIKETVFQEYKNTYIFF